MTQFGEFEARVGERMDKDELVQLINSDPELFELGYAMGLSDHRHNWRAMWVLSHAIAPNDPRIRPRINQLLDALPGAPDGYQRGILLILAKMELDEDQEGLLYGQCETIWLQAGKIPSVRVIAFRILLSIAEKYPEMKHEINLLLEEEYVESLSPGIRNSLLRLVSRM